MPDSFLERAAAHVLAGFGGEPESVAVVLPSQRAAVYFRNHLTEQIDTVQFTPALLTLDRFVADFTPLEKADQIELLFRLYSSYKEVWQNEAEPFDRFLKWAPMALADFSEVDAYCIDPKAFFRDLTNLKELDEWSLNAEELTQNQQNYSWFWKKLGELYVHFTKALKTDGLAYSGMLFRDAAEHIGSRTDQLKFKKVFFCGFNALSTSEKTIMQHFVKSEKGEMLWDADRFYLDYAQHEAGFFLRKNFKEFEGSEKWIGSDLTEKQKTITIAATPNEIAQSDLMAHLLKQPSDHTQTAVVLANEQMLSPVLNAIPENVSGVNVTMGLSTLHSPLHSLFDLLFEWMNARTPEGRYHYRYVLRLLSHPYMNFSGVFTKASHRLMATIKSQNKVFIHPDEIQSLGENEELTAFFKGITVSELSAQNQLSAQFQLLHFILASLPDSGKHNLEKEYLFHYLKALRRIENLVQRYPAELGGDAYARIFGTLTSGDKLNFVGEPLEGLQVMGMLETRALDFKNLIILSCNEHVMPGSGVQQSLIPFELKKYYRLPTRNEKEAIYAYYFYRLLQRAESVHLSYSTDTNSWQGAEPSRYLAQLQYDLKNQPNVTLQSVITKIEDRSVTVPNAAIQKTDEVLERIRKKLAFGLSPSALNKYLQCPLDFYYAYVLGFREQDEVEETIEHSTLGSTVHDVLEKLYTPKVANGVLKPDAVEAMRSDVRNLTREYLTKKFPGDAVAFGMNKLIFEVAVQFSDRFLLKETETLRAMAAENRFVQIVALEKKLAYTLEVPTPNGSVTVNLMGSADRVDQVGDTIRVIDYKTGKVEARDLKITDPEEELFLPEKSKALQLLIYGWMYFRQTGTEQPITAANVSMRNLSELLIPVSWKDKNALDANDWDEFEAVLKNVIGHILSPDTPLEHRPEAKYCQFCEVEEG